MSGQYTIIVKERLDSRWSGEFGALEVVPRDDGTTALIGPVRDRSELHGQIRRVEELGLTLVAVTPGGGAP